MSNTGFSTGCLHKSGLSMEEILRMYRKAGTDTVEISFGTPQSMYDFRLTDSLKETIRSFGHITIHAPWKEVKYDPADGAGMVTLKLLGSLCRIFDVEGIVMHPDILCTPSLLEEYDLPFLFENMDHRKKLYTEPRHFKSLKKNCKFGFVLDLQHAYEQDPSMAKAEEFIEVMGERLKEIHVSGCRGDEYHHPLHIAENREAIESILRYRLPVPMILEGRLVDDFQQIAIDELSYIRRFQI